MKKSTKANEAELSVRSKSFKIAHIFTLVILAAYCVYDFIVSGELSMVTAIWLISLASFFIAKLVYTKKIIEGDNDNETR